MSPDQNPDPAIREAYRQGERNAIVDARLADLERNQDGFRATLERQNQNAQRLETKIDGQSDKIDGIDETLRRTAAIEDDRNKRLKEANDRQISTRTFILGVIGVIVTMLAVIVTLLTAVH